MARKRAGTLPPPAMSRTTHVFASNTAVRAVKTFAPKRFLPTLFRAVTSPRLIGDGRAAVTSPGARAAHRTTVERSRTRRRIRHLPRKDTVCWVDCSGG